MQSYLPHKIFPIFVFLLFAAQVIINRNDNSQVLSRKTSYPTKIYTPTPTTNQTTLAQRRNRKPTPTPTSTPTNMPTATPPLTPTPITTTSLSWGAYTGWSASQATDLENRVGRKMNLVATFVHWGNESEFPAELADFALKNGKTLVIYWEAMDYNNPAVDNNPRYGYDEILRGGWDSYLSSFSKSAKAYQGKVIILPFEEANGDWYPWSATKNGNSIEKYKSAFRYIHKYFDGASNIKFGWDMNSESVPNNATNSLSNYYPGDEYVDYVGVNGFNFANPWLSFDAIFGSALRNLSAYKKPIYIFSMACADGPQKSAWIEDAIKVQMPKYPLLAGWIWFNENKEKNWLVWSDSNSLATFSSLLPK